MSDRKNSTIAIFDPKVIKPYSPFIEPVPPLEIEEATSGEIIVVCISKAFIPYINALVEPLTWDDNFTGTDEQRRKSTGLFEELRYLLTNGGGCMMDPCCPETNELLVEIRDYNLSISTSLTTIINNQTTIIDNSETIIDNGETVINQNYEQVINNAYNEFNSWVTKNYEQKTINSMIFDGNVESINNTLTDGQNWNGSGDDAGNGALCTAIKRYIDAVMYAENVYKSQEAQVIGGITSAAIAAGLTAAALTGGASIVAGLVVAGVGVAVGFAYSAWISAFNDPEVRRKVYCCMYDGLKDQAISEESFAASVNDCGFDGFSAEANVAQVINHYNGLRDEYLAFLRMYNEGQAGSAAGCLCDCDTDIVLEDFVGRGCTITYMGNCIWKFDMNPIADFWYASFKDILDRCLLVEFAPGYPYPSVSDCVTDGCCPVTHYDGVGGFAPGSFTQVDWRTGYGGGNATQYYKITLRDMEDCE